MSCSSDLLSKCPNAPNRGVNGKLPLWERVRRSGLVRSKFAFYTPDDVKEIDCSEKLKAIYAFYTFPDTKLRGEGEEFYCRWMSLCAWGKIFKV